MTIQSARTTIYQRDDLAAIATREIVEPDYILCTARYKSDRKFVFVF